MRAISSRIGMLLLSASTAFAQNFPGVSTAGAASTGISSIPSAPGISRPIPLPQLVVVRIDGFEDVREDSGDVKLLLSLGDQTFQTQRFSTVASIRGATAFAIHPQRGAEKRSVYAALMHDNAVKKDELLAHGSVSVATLTGRPLGGEAFQAVWQRTVISLSADGRGIPQEGAVTGEARNSSSISTSSSTKSSAKLIISYIAVPGDVALRALTGRLRLLFDRDASGALDTAELGALLRSLDLDTPAETLLQQQAGRRASDPSQNASMPVERAVSGVLVLSQRHDLPCPYCRGSWRWNPSRANFKGDGEEEGEDGESGEKSQKSLSQGQPPYALAFTCLACELTVGQPGVKQVASVAQSRRSGLSRLFNRLGFGRYGADLQLLVLDRETGQLVEERSFPFMKALLHQGYNTPLRGLLEAGFFKRAITHMTFAKGEEYDRPESRAEIQSFVDFFGIDLREYEKDRVDAYTSFNDFFYRKLKPGLRPPASTDPRVALCAADSRLMVFPRVEDARVWVKGDGFSLGRLLGSAELARSFAGGAMAIFRLAPQDFHRFAAPVFGTMESTPRDLGREYYTVNPAGLRSDIDVLGENRRAVALINSPQFGRVAYIPVGAALVGSIVWTAKPGTPLKPTDEMGYFAFGGSTVVLLFEPGAIVFDRDLVENSAKSLETLVKVGQTLGTRG